MCLCLRLCVCAYTGMREGRRRSAGSAGNAVFFFARRKRSFVGGPVGEGERSPEHSEAALPSPAQPRPLPPPPELPVNVEPRIPEVGVAGFSW